MERTVSFFVNEIEIHSLFRNFLIENIIHLYKIKYTFVGNLLCKRSLVETSEFFAIFANKNALN